MAIASLSAESHGSGLSSRTVRLFGSETWFLGLPRMWFKLFLIGLYGIKSLNRVYLTRILP